MPTEKREEAKTQTKGWLEERQKLKKEGNSPTQQRAMAFSRSVRGEENPRFVLEQLNWSETVSDLLKKRKEEEELNEVYEERKQMLESLEQRIKELPNELKKAEELHFSFDMFLKDKEADQAVEKAEKERKEVIDKESKIERLKEENAELKERKQELLHQVQRHSVYPQFMERVLKMTEFENVQALTDHLENNLHIRDQLCQRESEVQEQAIQLRKALLTLEDQHHLMQLNMNNQLSQLQIELQETRSEAEIWERKWKNIQKTAAKKKLQLGQIKMATLNLYEMTGGEVGEEEGVDMNDTETQLDKIKIFIQDHNDIVKAHQTPNRQRNGPKRDKTRKHTHSKKH